MKEKQAKPIRKEKPTAKGENLKETNTGLKVDLFYGLWNTEDLDYQTNLGDPGDYPYTRGIYPTMRRIVREIRSERLVRVTIILKFR